MNPRKRKMTENMWQLEPIQSTKRKNQYKMANLIKFCQSSSNVYYYVALFIMLFLPNNIDANISNATLLITPLQYYKGSKYTVDDLLNTKFTSKVSDDIDMDPCKASM